MLCAHLKINLKMNYKILIIIISIFFLVSCEQNNINRKIVNQKTFAGILGRVLGRPLLGYCPGFILKTFMGLMGEELVLGGRDVLPSKLMNKGFVWEDRELEGF